jgi:phosphoribosylaminoimidazolecarboxamide formyltransferase / IMP cyclohydrolase
MDASQPAPERFALISVSDKVGVVELASALVAHGYTLLSTGGTASALRAAGLTVLEVAAVTSSPELLDGRVKTLHPLIHGGLLARRELADHRDTMAAHGIPDIQILVVNLYPFVQTIARAGVTEAEAIEQIDIGGPAMIRAASKNFQHVTVLTTPADYPRLIDALPTGGLDHAQRRQLAARAYAHTAAYDAAITAYLAAGDDALPEVLVAPLMRTMSLRYGENPHQQAALYQAPGAPALGGLAQLHGKELSYNNIVDLDAALELLGEVADAQTPGCAIIKHTNPAGCALGDTLAAAYEAALRCDPTSAFGGIVALSQPVDAALAARLSEHFYEIIAAPDFTPEALAALQTKKNVRLMRVPAGLVPPARMIRETSMGALLQTADGRITGDEGWRVVTKVAPDAAQLAALRFLWRVCKHVKSNAIVLGDGARTLGVGAGQMSRVDSVRIAVEKARGVGLEPGASMASDAFFPFPDGPQLAIDAGIRAIIQPGGSVRDQEVIDACDAAGVAMVFTGERHFRHG